jgi:hypothetical protein
VIIAAGDSGSMSTILPLSSFAMSGHTSAVTTSGYTPSGTAGTPPRRGPLDLRSSGEVMRSPNTSLSGGMAGSISAPSSSSLLGGRSQVRLLPPTSLDDVTSSTSTSTGSAPAQPDRHSGSQHHTGYGMLLHYSSDNGYEMHSRPSPGSKLGPGSRSDLLHAHSSPQSPHAYGANRGPVGQQKSHKSTDGRWQL